MPRYWLPDVATLHSNLELEIQGRLYRAIQEAAQEAVRYRDLARRGPGGTCMGHKSE